VGDIEQDLAEERECLHEDLQARADWDEVYIDEHRQDPVLL
jgi:hypothetical protein